MQSKSHCSQLVAEWNKAALKYVAGSVVAGRDLTTVGHKDLSFHNRHLLFQAFQRTFVSKTTNSFE